VNSPAWRVKASAVAAVIKLTDRKTKSLIATGESWIMIVDRTGTVRYGIMPSEVSRGRDSLRIWRSSCRKDAFSTLTTPHHKHKISYKMLGLTLLKNSVI